jgi:hypothetical protein
MSKDIESIAVGLFDKIRSRFSPITLGDQKAKSTDVPEQARFFNFTYTDKSGNQHGEITISLIGEDSLKINFGKNIVQDMDRAQRKEWYSFLRSLRKFAMRNLLTFDTRDIAKSGLQISDVQQQVKANSVSNSNDIAVTESRLYGTPGRPRHSVGEHAGIRIKILHNEPVVDEVRGSRTRKIENIFLETPIGERFKCVHNSLPAARALAVHISQGGSMHDDVAECINNMVYEMKAMRHFVRSTKNRQFEDAETDNMARAATRHFMKLQKTLNHLAVKKYYDEFVEDFIQPTPLEDEIDVDALKERFVKKVYDARFDEALPIVYREYCRQQNNLAHELDEWASVVAEDFEQDQDEVVDADAKLRALQELCKSPLRAGINGIDAKTDLEPIINNLPGADQLTHSITTLSDPTRGQGSDADVRTLIKAWARQNKPDWAEQLEFGAKNIDNAHTNWKPPVSPGSPHPNDQYGAANASLDDPVTDPNIPTAVQEDSLDFIRFLAGLKK